MLEQVLRLKNQITTVHFFFKTVFAVLIVVIFNNSVVTCWNHLVLKRYGKDDPGLERYNHTSPLTRFEIG